MSDVCVASVSERRGGVIESSRHTRRVTHTLQEDAWLSGRVIFRTRTPPPINHMAARPFDPPCQVEVHSLNGRPDLNGKSGRADSFDADSCRYYVTLENGETVALSGKTFVKSRRVEERQTYQTRLRS